MLSRAAQTSRVLLINDDSFELATMAASLRLHSVNIIGEASNMLIAENLFRSLQPEAVLIDLQFSGEEAVGLLQRLRKVDPSLGITTTPAVSIRSISGIQCSLLSETKSTFEEKVTLSIGSVITDADEIFSKALILRALSWAETICRLT